MNKLTNMTSFARKTKHKKPKFQLYQFGFNAGTGKWLEGSWVTVSEEDWISKKSEHEEMCQRILMELKNYTYNGFGVPLNRMTKEQRQAWEHFSGVVFFDVVYPNKYIGVWSAEMSGNRLSKQSEEWARKHDIKLLQWVKETPQGAPLDKVKGYDIPSDLIIKGSSNREPVDIGRRMFDQKVEDEMILFSRMTEVLRATDALPPNYSYPPEIFVSDQVQFFSGLVFSHLVSQEEKIVRIQWEESCGNTHPYTNVEKEQERYVWMRNLAYSKSFDKATFDDRLAEARKEHNQTAREVLDSSNGCRLAFVIPKFYEDGAFDPVGEKDYPWGEL